jgi:hypothetical protein
MHRKGEYNIHCPQQAKLVPLCKNSKEELLKQIPQSGLTKCVD